jgi:tRNA(adenine34) deaminase
MVEHDEHWMRCALALAERAAAEGEVPVGAVLIWDGEVVGEGWNRPIAENDPSAHAEIRALRDAGRRLGNYRMPGAKLYVTLEPCPMCAGAIIQARLDRVLFGATDPKGGACGSVFELLPSDNRFNHRTDCSGGLLAEECCDLLRDFFQKRR